MSDAYIDELLGKNDSETTSRPVRLARKIGGGVVVFALCGSGANLGAAYLMAEQGRDAAQISADSAIRVAEATAKAEFAKEVAAVECDDARRDARKQFIVDWKDPNQAKLLTTPDAFKDYFTEIELAACPNWADYKPTKAELNAAP